MAATLGQLLVEKKLLTDAQLAEAIDEQNREKVFLGTVVLRRGWVEDKRLLEAIAEYFQVECVRLKEAKIMPDAVAEVPMKIATHYRVMPIKIEGGVLTLAITNPQDIRLMDDVKLALHQRYKLHPVVATEADIQQCINKHYGMGAETVQDLVHGQGQGKAADHPQKQEEGLVDLTAAGDNASVVKLVNQLILEAHRQRATDIHLEPFRGSVRLRYRIDGMLKNLDVPAEIKQFFPAIVSRVKVLSNLNIVERRLPQDGRASVKVGEEKIDLRIGILPTPAGESVVIRILPNNMLLTLDDLGYGPDALKLIAANIHKPHGIIFVTGPTGSGKTTTLYACLNTINTETRKIITLEDPVEYELPGVTQVQVRPEIGLTFAGGLRSMLRHDPDVMMVGEVRDTETVELAVRIALTGHLVLSTLHTNDAVSSLMRLTDMGVDPYLIASSCECIIAQRLVRLLCEHCKQPTRGEDEVLIGPFQAPGCEHCSQTGFYGRTAVYEILPVTYEIRTLIVKNEPVEAVRRAALASGMCSMRDTGEAKVKQGLTTRQEVLRVVQEEDSG